MDKKVRLHGAGGLLRRCDIFYLRRRGLPTRLARNLVPLDDPFFLQDPCCTDDYTTSCKFTVGAVGMDSLSGD